MAIDKLVVSSEGVKAMDFTVEEFAQRILEQQQAEQQTQLDLLIPSQDQVDQAEFELKTITLLQEVSLL